MNNLRAQTKQEIIAQHVYMFRVIYPDLYDYLMQRDHTLHRILLRLPDPADPEAGAAGVDFGRLVMELKALPPGVGELGREQHTNSEQARMVYDGTRGL